MQDEKKEEEIRNELTSLVDWVYKSIFAEVFNYDRATQKRTLSKTTEEKINKILKMIKCK